jgi:aspartate racemase
MHIGLIGGIGPAATEFYYRGLIDRHTQCGTTLDLTIAHAEVRELTRNLSRRDSQAQATVFARLVERLAAAGAKKVAVTSMGGHFAIQELKAVSALSVIDALPAIELTLKKLSLRRVGLIGTRTVMETRLYGRVSAVDFVLPQGDALDQVHQNYVQMAEVARVTPQQREVFFTVGKQLCREQGAEAVLLGGTDLFLAFAGQDPGFPVIDGATIHIDAIYREST